MNGQARIQVRTTLAGAAGRPDSRLKTCFLICMVVLGLAFVAIIGVIRLFQSLNDGALSAWRLAVLFASIFGCVTVVCALYGRGRSPSRPRPVGRRL
ncbi:MAG: hypothetical protein ACHQAY_04865 [Hyphomicrobiales bacterium]